MGSKPNGQELGRQNISETVKNACEKLGDPTFGVNLSFLEEILNQIATPNEVVRFFIDYANHYEQKYKEEEDSNSLVKLRLNDLGYCLGYLPLEKSTLWKNTLPFMNIGPSSFFEEMTILY